eukprot:403367388
MFPQTYPPQQFIITPNGQILLAQQQVQMPQIQSSQIQYPNYQTQYQQQSPSYTLQQGFYQPQFKHLNHSMQMIMHQPILRPTQVSQFPNQILNPLELTHAQTDQGNIRKSEVTRDQSQQISQGIKNITQECTCPCKCGARQQYIIIEVKEPTSEQEIKKTRKEDKIIFQSELTQQICKYIDNEDTEDKKMTECDLLRKKLRLNPKQQLIIIDGCDIPENQIPRRKYMPSSKQYKMIKIFKPERRRWYLSFLCKYENCNFILRKWGNLFDHLRIHTLEKPFRCPVNKCSKAFAQKSNMVKHFKNHEKPFLRCYHCKRIIPNNKMIKHNQRHLDSGEQNLTKRERYQIPLEAKKIFEVQKIDKKVIQNDNSSDSFSSQIYSKNCLTESQENFGIIQAILPSQNQSTINKDLFIEEGKILQTLEKQEIEQMTNNNKNLQLDQDITNNYE